MYFKYKERKAKLLDSVSDNTHEEDDGKSIEKGINGSKKKPPQELQGNDNDGIPLITNVELSNSQMRNAERNSVNHEDDEQEEDKDAEDNEEDKEYDEHEPLKIEVDSPEKEEEEVVEQPSVPRKMKRIHVLYYLIVVSEVILALILFFLWDVLNAFDMIYPNMGSVVLKTLLVLVVFPLLVFRFYILYGAKLQWINPNVSWAIKGPLIFLVVSGIFLYNWGIMVFFKGLCIANHNNDIPGFHFTNFGITSALTRSWYHDTCPNKGKPCFVYTTLPEDALGSVFISFHINPHSCKGD